VAETLGIIELISDPVGLSEEAREQIIYERGQESFEQII